MAASDSFLRSRFSAGSGRRRRYVEINPPSGRRKLPAGPSVSPSDVSRRCNGRQMAGINWGDALDFRRAAANVRTEIVGDWHHDPWGSPEMEFIFAKEAEPLLAHLRENRSDTAALIDVLKENWGSRPAVAFSVLDRLTYQSLVDRFSVDLIGDLHRSVYGWRLPHRILSAGSIPTMICSGTVIGITSRAPRRFSKQVYVPTWCRASLAFRLSRCRSQSMTSRERGH